MSHRIRPSYRVVLGLLLAPWVALPAFAVEPGIDFAVPRITVSFIGASLAFAPANLVIEQGDFVRWNNVGGNIHTSTSGPTCGVLDGNWNFPLNPLTQTPVLLLSLPPQKIPYYCSPHCLLGMTGSVTITGPIDLKAAQSAGILALSWTGGSGHYQVFRSDNALFNPPNTQTLSPDGGFDSGTTFTDTVSQPAPGKVFFYLVMNRSLS